MEEADNRPPSKADGACITLTRNPSGVHIPLHRGQHPNECRRLLSEQVRTEPQPFRVRG